MHDSDSCSEIKLLVLELEEVLISIPFDFDVCFTYIFTPSIFFRICNDRNPIQKVSFCLLPDADSFFLLTSYVGLPRPNESAKRERETRRSSFSNELGSPISASKGEKRTPSHGVWSLASHRDNWRSALSVGTLLLYWIFQYSNCNCAANTCACVGFYLYILASKASGM